jgi:hypothetical protein
MQEKSALKSCYITYRTEQGQCRSQQRLLGRRWLDRRLVDVDKRRNRQIEVEARRQILKTEFN